MSVSAKIREQVIKNFRAELQEHVQRITDGLLVLEQGNVAAEQWQELVEEIFRAAHSLKGAARAVGVTAIEQLAHALENVLDAMQRGAIELKPELFTACYHALDAIQVVQTSYEAGEITPPPQALQALSELSSFRTEDKQRRKTAPAPFPQISVTEENGEPRPEPEVPAFTAPPAGGESGSDETIRVDVSKLDALMAQLSELFITKIRAEQRLEQVQRAREATSRLQKEWLAIRSAYNRVNRRKDVLLAALARKSRRRKLDRDVEELLNYFYTNQEQLAKLNSLMNNLARQYTDDTLHMALAIDALEEDIKRTRMLPLNTITGTFGRMVRDLAYEADKEVSLKIVGGDTELDKRVLERIKDPLIHLLRNSIDHGIEAPEKREKLGKPRRGTITLTAEQLGKDVLIAVSDDGAGLNVEAIRNAVARRERLDPRSLSESELIDYIFSSGVTTSPLITDVSGRGVGLDVVRRNVEALHGRIDVEFEPESGTTFILTLPLTLTSSRSLLMRISTELFAVPLNAVERILLITPDQISPLEGRDTVRYQGRPLTLVHLSDILNLPRVEVQRDDNLIMVVVLAAAERRMAFVVDDLAGEQEVVIKGLGKQLSRVGGIAGATVMGSGEVVLILNVADLIKLAMRGAGHSVIEMRAAVPAAVSRAGRRILVVDDSITTRTLEKNILEAAGYAVDLATDGQEALSVIASREMPDLVVTDIAMPRMGGFELTRQLKGDARTANVPVILVTSLDSPEDKAQGIEVGADAYIVKGNFDQRNLLETIEQLI